MVGSSTLMGYDQDADRESAAGIGIMRDITEKWPGSLDANLSGVGLTPAS